MAEFDKLNADAHDGSSGQAVAYFPIQNVEKIRFRMSSAVVAPVMASIGRRAAYKSSSSIS